MLSGDNGILKRAGDARDDTVIGQEKEQVELAYISAAVKKLGDNVDKNDLQDELDLSVGENKTTVTGSGMLKVKFEDTGNYYIVSNDGSVKKNETLSEGQMSKKTEENNYSDKSGNTATIPAKFVVSNIEGETDINKGLVIYLIPEDEYNNGINWKEKDPTYPNLYAVQTKYSQFVWIPVENAIYNSNKISNLPTSNTSGTKTKITDELGNINMPYNYTPMAIDIDSENNQDGQYHLNDTYSAILYNFDSSSGGYLMHPSTTNYQAGFRRIRRTKSNIKNC